MYCERFLIPKIFPTADIFLLLHSEWFCLIFTFSAIGYRMIEG
jgi:hypothetical protein